MKFAVGGRLRVGAPGVDVAAALDLVGAVLAILGLAYLVPTGVALGYGEPFWPFLASGAIASAAGLALARLTHGRQRAGVREGFLVIALVWLLVPAFAALPYLLAGEAQLSNPIDAYFEAVSGFTATGATVLTDIEALDQSLLFWRQFTQWLGGMGIVVLAIAVLPRLRIGGRQLLQSELAGPTETERLTASIRDTARRLWFLYLGLTAAMALALMAIGWTSSRGMDPFQAIAHAFSGIAIGGFSTENESLAAFDAATQWTVLVFIAVAGVNFLRLYRVLVQRQPRSVARDEELRLYFVFIVLGSALLLVELLASGIASGEGAVRGAVFQAVSIMTTTGFATENYVEWGALAELTLLLLMFVGASAGSTGGSVKVVRHLLIGRIVRRELDQTVHREVVQPVRLSGASVDERALRSVVTFVLLYVGLFAVASIALAIEARAHTGFGITSFEAIGAAAACLGNVGPAFGFAGPFGSYEGFSDLSTGILTGLMWLGRLEIIPVVVLLTRSYWRP